MRQSVRAVLATAAVMVVAACAAGGRTGSGAGATGTVRATGSSQFEVEVKRTELISADTVGADAARAFAAIPAVYQVLGLPVTKSDRVGRTITVVEFRPRRIENQPLSRFLDCGQGPTAGANADSYEIFLSVETSVIAGSDPSHAVVRSTLSAYGRPIASSGNAVSCSSKGLLETRIAELVRARLAAAGG